MGGGREMTAWSKGKGLRPPHQDCWALTQFVMATSDPLGPDSNPSQRKKQINKKYINSLFTGSWVCRGGGKRGMGPGPWKRRANSHKGLKIEHVSEATAGQAEWGCLTLGGRADPGTQTDTCAWDSPGQWASTVFTFPPHPGHGKEAQLNT